MSDPTPLDQAQAWLDDWKANGGGVTIDPSGNLHPWRTMHADDMKDYARRCAHAEIAEKMLGHLVSHTELLGPMRVILSSRARITAKRALGDIL